MIIEKQAQQQTEKNKPLLEKRYPDQKPRVQKRRKKGENDLARKEK